MKDRQELTFPCAIELLSAGSVASGERRAASPIVRKRLSSAVKNNFLANSHFVSSALHTNCIC